MLVYSQCQSGQKSNSVKRGKKSQPVSLSEEETNVRPVRRGEKSQPVRKGKKSQPVRPVRRGKKSQPVRRLDECQWEKETLSVSVSEEEASISVSDRQC